MEEVEVCDEKSDARSDNKDFLQLEATSEGDGDPGVGTETVASSTEEETGKKRKELQTSPVEGDKKECKEAGGSTTQDVGAAALAVGSTPQAVGSTPVPLGEPMQVPGYGSKWLWEGAAKVGEDAGSAPGAMVKEEEGQETPKRHKKEQEDERVQWKKDGWRESRSSKEMWKGTENPNADDAAILTGMMSVVSKMQKDLEEQTARGDKAERKAANLEAEMQLVRQENLALKETVRKVTRILQGNEKVWEELQSKQEELEQACQVLAETKGEHAALFGKMRFQDAELAKGVVVDRQAR